MDKEPSLGNSGYAVPLYTFEGLNDYASERRPPSGFLRALLENDLEMTVARADAANLSHLRETLRHARATLPRESWGSPQAVREWLRETR